MTAPRGAPQKTAPAPLAEGAEQQSRVDADTDQLSAAWTTAGWLAERGVNPNQAEAVARLAAGWRPGDPIPVGALIPIVARRLEPAASR